VDYAGILDPPQSAGREAGLFAAPGTILRVVPAPAHQRPASG
jgi:hypothetical protein